MFGSGTLELLIVLVLVMIIFGPAHNSLSLM